MKSELRPDGTVIVRDEHDATVATRAPNGTIMWHKCDRMAEARGLFARVPVRARRRPNPRLNVRVGR